MNALTTVVPIEHEIKVTPNTNVQIKLLSSIRSQNIDNVIKTLKATLGIGDFSVLPEDVKSIIDDYYDTEDLALYYTHSVFRIRREGVQPTLVIKQLVRQAQGELERTEYETSLSEIELQNQSSQSFPEVVASQLPDIRDKKLAYLLKVTNERRNYLMERKGERYRLSLDMFVYANPKTGRTSDQQFEVEIEALNDAASAKLNNIKHNLLDVLTGFKFSAGSKYERGIKMFYIDSAEWKQVLAAWSSGIGLAWIGAIFGILGLIVGIVGVWLTIKSL